MKTQILLLLLATLTMASCAKDDKVTPVSPATLEGAKWKLLSITPEENVLSTCQKEVNTIWEFKDGKIYTSPAPVCFGYSGESYKLEGNEIILPYRISPGMTTSIAISGTNMTMTHHIDVTGYKYDIVLKFKKQ